MRHIVILSVLISLILSTSFALCGENEYVQIDANKLKADEVSGTAKGIFFMPINAYGGQLPVFRFRNDLLTPRTIHVRITGLAEPDYDVYVNGDYVGKFKREKLESGIPVKLSGTQILPVYRTQYFRIRTRALNASSRYQTGGEDTELCLAFLRGVAEWVDSIESGDRRVRTVTIITAPADRAFSVPGERVLAPPEDLPYHVKRLGDSIQIARRDINKKIKNESYRNDTILALTPIDMTILTPMHFIPGKKSVVRVVIDNSTDRVVTGKVKLMAPAGWKVRTISDMVKMESYGKRGEAYFEVVVPKSQKPAGVIGANANLMVEDVPLVLQAVVQKK